MEQSEATFIEYCMDKSPEGHSCGLPKYHPEDFHFGGSPMLPDVEWVRWPVEYVTWTAPDPLAPDEVLPGIQAQRYETVRTKEGEK